VKPKEGNSGSFVFTPLPLWERMNPALAYKGGVKVRGREG